MPDRKYRRCQECGVVSQASAFRRVAFSAQVSPDTRYRCPGCGDEAPMWAFLPAELPAEAEGPGGTEPSQPGTES